MRLLYGFAINMGGIEGLNKLVETTSLRCIEV